jgi:hypothetical protein
MDTDKEPDEEDAVMDSQMMTQDISIGGETQELSEEQQSVETETLQTQDTAMHSVDDEITAASSPGPNDGRAVVDGPDADMSSQFMTQDIPIDESQRPSTPEENGDESMAEPEPEGPSSETVEDGEEAAAPKSPASSKSGSDADSESEKSGAESGGSSPGRKKKLTKRRVRRALDSSDEEGDEGAKSGGEEETQRRSR